MPSRWENAVEGIVLLAFTGVWAATVLGTTVNNRYINPPLVLLLTTVMALLVGSIAGFRAREIVQVAESIGIEVTLGGDDTDDESGAESTDDDTDSGGEPNDDNK